MHNSDYYREQAAEYRKLAEAADNPAAKKEFLELQKLAKRPPIRLTTVELADSALFWF